MISHFINKGRRIVFSPFFMNTFRPADIYMKYNINKGNEKNVKYFMA